MPNCIYCNLTITFNLKIFGIGKPSYQPTAIFDNWQVKSLTLFHLKLPLICFYMQSHFVDCASTLSIFHDQHLVMVKDSQISKVLQACFVSRNDHQGLSKKF